MDPNKPVPRRNVLIGGVLSAVAFGIAACGNAISSLTPKPSTAGASAGPGSSSAPSAAASLTGGTLKYWTPPMAAEGVEAFWAEQMAAYKTLTGTEVEVRVIPWETLLETLTTGYSGSEPPDVVYLVPDFLGRFSKGGHLRDMGAVPAAAAWKSEFPDDLWGGAFYKGKQWGPPNITSAPAFIWNKSHFEAAGLDPEAPPKTWEDVRAYAKKLTKPGGAQWGFGIIDPWTEALNFVPNAIVNYGSDLTNPDDTQWVANTPEAVAGLEAMRVMYVDDKTAPPIGTFADFFKSFYDGKISMAQALPGYISGLATEHPEFPLGVGSEPAGPANNKAFGGIGLYSISAKADVERAGSLVDFLISPDPLADFALFSNNPPARKGVNPFPAGSLLDKFIKVAAPQLRNPILPIDFWQTFIDNCQAAFLGQKTSQEALDDAATKINADLAAAG
jgi:ABC-type glycerol-3-phosphate transport system substrate-binding protein